MQSRWGVTSAMIGSVKVYVTKLGVKDERGGPFVDYSETPSGWTSLEDAKKGLRTLQEWNPSAHVGPHRCSFSIEPVDGQGYAVVCKNHPQIQAVLYSQNQMYC